MKVSRLLLPLSLLAAVPVGIAFNPTSETLDLTPRFKEGRTITISQTFTAEGALDELEVMVDGAQAIDGSAISADLELPGTIEMSEEVLAVRDGQIAKINVTMDTMDVGVSGSYDAMGDGDDIDESVETDVVGHTVAITIDEEGEVTREDVTEGDMEPLTPEEMAGMTHKNHFEMLLPEEPVEEGTPFELAPDWEELMRDTMSSMDTAGMGEDERRAAEGFMNAFVDATTLDAVGTVTGVEDGVATIDYELSASMNIDDLVEVLKSIAPPGEMDEVPPGIESMVEATAEFSGTGTFDMKLGQMTSLNLAGDLEISVSGNADMGGSSASASLLMSGSMEIAAKLTAEDV